MLRPKPGPLLEEACEAACRFAVRRTWKHAEEADSPSDEMLEALIDNLSNELWSALEERFYLDEDAKP